MAACQRSACAAWLTTVLPTRRAAGCASKSSGSIWMRRPGRRCERVLLPGSLPACLTADCRARSVLHGCQGRMHCRCPRPRLPSLSATPCSAPRPTAAGASRVPGCAGCGGEVGARHSVRPHPRRARHAGEWTRVGGAAGPSPRNLAASWGGRLCCGCGCQPPPLAAQPSGKFTHPPTHLCLLRAGGGCGARP